MGEKRCFAADVSKKELIVALYPEHSPVVAIANTARAINAWLDRVPGGSLIAMEATGSYHRALAELAHARGFLVYVVNPRAVYYYARGLAMRGKTDRIDARIIARYVVHEQSRLHPYVPASALCERVQTLLQRRASLVRNRQALRQSLADLTLKEKGALFDAIAALEKAIDRELVQLVGGDEQMGKLFTRLKSIRGVAKLVASLLCNLLNRFDFRNAEALIAYLGLDPRPDESGQRRGARRLSKQGDPEWRRLLVAAAMSAARAKVWRDYVARQRSKGLPATAVHVILARKILRVAFALSRNGKTFDPAFVQRA
jgi:transposase